MLTFGYENEYFLKKDGQILLRVPDYSLPHDAHGVLVEVRSEPFENPYQTLASFNTKYAELVEAVAKHRCTLENIPEHNVGLRIETAGLHIHFSTPKWHAMNQRLAPGDYPPEDVADWVTRLDARFKKFFEGVKRHPHYWRPKYHGWEYRRLPATVDLTHVTQVLAEEFYRP